jgi:periplasmic protein TonB
MKYQLKAFQMSLALHALVIIFLIVMSSTLPHGDNLIVVDFTIDDAPGTALLINKAAGTVNRGAHEQQKIKHEEAESTRQSPEIEKSSLIPLPPEHQEKQQAILPEARVQSPEQDEKIPDSERDDRKSDADHNAPFTSSNATALLKSPAGKLKASMTETGENAANMPRAGVPGYIKANFAYIKDIINRHIAYPGIARQMGWTGKVKISFIITVNGDARNIRVIESSGKEILDRNATDAVKKASPFPRPPVEAKIIMPVLYRLY